MAPATSVNVMLLADDCHWKPAAPYPVAGLSDSVAVPDIQTDEGVTVAVTVAGNTITVS